VTIVTIHFLPKVCKQSVVTIFFFCDHISSVIVRMLSSSVVDNGFEPILILSQPVGGISWFWVNQLVDILILSQLAGGISWFWVNQLVDILILSQPVFVLTLKCCVFSGKPTNTNFDVFYVQFVEKPSHRKLTWIHMF
jgi:hypothetical protein